MDDLREGPEATNKTGVEPLFIVLVFCNRLQKERVFLSILHFIVLVKA